MYAHITIDELKIIFFHSLQLINKSLSASVNNLKPDDRFKYTSKCFSVNTQLMTEEMSLSIFIQKFLRKF